VTALFGRSAEFARLRDWLAEAVGGLPQVVVCSGEAGIGKTRLLEALSDEAESGGGAGALGAVAGAGECAAYWLRRQLFGTDAVTAPVPVTGPVTGARHTSWGPGSGWVALPSSVRSSGYKLICKIT
jgi:hypothetical protein